jgi:TonB-dependent starch-binding outer membrane protein SusC
MPFSISRLAVPAFKNTPQRLPIWLPLKTLRLMNWTAAFVLAGCLQVSAAGYSQGKITLSVKNAPLEIIFASIEEQSGYTIWYDNSILKNSSSIDIDVQDVSLEQALTLCCKNQPLTYNIIGKMVVVTQKKSIPGIDPPIKIDVKGKLMNERGDPVSGVSIIVRGTNIGTMSDNEGKFKIPNIDENSILIFTGTNIERLEEKLGSRKEFTIIVKTKINKLDEIQIIGYGTTTKRLGTGSLSEVGSDIIEKQPVTNVLEALEGQVAGLQITQANGLPGSPITVQIRGQNSIAASNNPLYIIDGVPFTSMPVEYIAGPNGGGSLGASSPMNLINPEDIESISVLKDADATAIYGSRASNGVILIVTKKAKSGKEKFQINFNSGVGKTTRMAPLLNTPSYIQLRTNALVNSNLPENSSTAPDLTVWDTTQSFDWQKWYMGGTDRITDFSVNYEGGDLQTSFLLNGAYHDESTVLPGNNSYKRENIHLNVNHHSPNNKFYLNSTIFYTNDNSLFAGTTNGEVLFILQTPPNYPIYDSLGKLNWTGDKTNYFAELKSYMKSQSDNLNMSVAFRYNILPGLNLNANIGYNKVESNQNQAYPITSINPAYNPTGNAVFANQNATTALFEPQINYSKKNGRGDFGLLLGSTIQNSTLSNRYLYAVGYTNDLLIESLNYGTIAYQSENSTNYKYLSFYGRMTYNWSNKYIFDLNFRRDGSSRFGPGKQFGNFGSIAGAWLFSNETAIKNKVHWLTHGKLRASYGTVGNDGIGDYGYLSIYTNTTNYGNANAILPSQIANPDFQWEINKKFEIALEVGALKDKILGTLSWYHNIADNQLVGYSLPSITGFTSYQANLPAVIENSGWEFELNTITLKTTFFTWTSSLNFAVPQNKLVSFPGLASSTYANAYVIGEPLSIVQKFKFLGVDPKTGLSLIQDVNKDGQIIPSSSYNGQGGDYVIAGKTSPDFFGGFNNSFEYKGFQLDIFIQFVKQEGYNDFSYSMPVFGQPYNVWNDYLGYWRNPGDKAVIPKPFATTDNSLLQFSNSDATFTDASFIRLKTVSISYTFKKLAIHQFKISSLNLFLRGQNLLTITNYKGYDPETAGNPTLLVPPLKMISAGIKCSL